MHTKRLGKDVVVWAPAKINLFLEILGKRPDGYHELETLMVAVNRFDTLVFGEAEPGKDLLVCNLPELTTGPENLVHRAARLLRRVTGCQKGFWIRLVKRIPMQAGLGGGSSDAAAALAGLNELWQLGLSRENLISLGGELGSDVPFFFHGPAAWCSGRGEKVTPIQPGGSFDLVLVCPNQGLATAEVYKKVQIPTRPVSGEVIREALVRGDWKGIVGGLHNRLQEAAFALLPKLAEICQHLKKLGAHNCLMSGSGSSVFALAANSGEAKRILHHFRFEAEEAGQVFSVRTLFHQGR